MDGKENDPEEIISFEAVREFLEKHGGRVRQTDLVNNFRYQLSSPATKVRARQEFKDILQLITAVKTENGEKFIVLIKQQQEHFQASVINRKANRPLSVRKELAKSKIEFYQGYDHEDYTPNQHHASSTTLDSRIASETTSMRSVSSLRSALSVKVKNSQSMDSINDYMVEGEDGDLEDEIGLNDDSVVLPEEKEWMLASANGRLEALKKLLVKYPELAKKRDFVLGYTALHWAAKLGRSDMVKFIAHEGVDIHIKSHGGYTPLHIAAMSGKDQVITQLIELHGANIHARDHSGKKPKDVVRDTVAADVQRKLGRSLVLEPNMVSATSGYRTQLSPPIPRRRVSNPNSDIESPIGTPEVARRHLKSIGASAQRSMSFLKKKKKHDPRLRIDIQHSPQVERNARKDVEQNVPWKKELAMKKEIKREQEKKRDNSKEKKVRPQSMIVNSPTKTNAPESLGQTTMSFEI